LADEPTGNLDSRRGEEILELLAGICREGRAGALLVTHDAQAAEIADRVLVLRDGRIEARGDARADASPDVPPDTSVGATARSAARSATP
ncbi:MAG TPA: hypothetical protein VK506_08930, partial [Conexibacter sp.]|nr:hypothetical protein [Conexibacter sp.]